MSTEPQSTTFLTKRLVVDVAAAAAASLGVSPFITVVDRAIIENANGTRPLAQGLKDLSLNFVKHPLKFVRRREFLLIFGLYSATYVSANATDSVCDYVERDNQMPKFISTTAVNMSLCIAKDREFTRMFGVIAPSPFPLASIGLFAIRDSLTVAASFNAPTYVSRKLQQDSGMTKSNADTTAQLVCPAAVQFISTPLHLLGLDLYNNRNVPASQRVSLISREYLKSAFARICRIGPAFGIGGVGNKYFRDELRTTFALH